MIIYKEDISEYRWHTEASNVIKLALFISHLLILKDLTDMHITYRSEKNNLFQI